MLKIENIDVYYGAIHAVKNVSFEVGEGEIVALIGANGAGKSTILKTVSGLMHPRTGTITFCDQNITHMDAYKLLRTGLAHVPEGRRIFLEMTVQENLEMGAYIRKTVDEADLEKVFTYFPRLKERQQADRRYPLRRRAADAGHGLGPSCPSPSLMMLDEPSMGLAPIIVDQVFGIIKELHKSRHHHPSGGAERQEWPCKSRTGPTFWKPAPLQPSGTGAGACRSPTRSAKKAYLGG